MAAPTTLGRLVSKGRTAEIFEFGEGRVLKLFSTSFPKSRAEDEARISQLLSTSGAPVPTCFDLIAWGERWGIVYQQVAGETMLIRMQKRPWLVPSLAGLLAELHWEIHQLEIPQLEIPQLEIPHVGSPHVGSHGLESQTALFRRQLSAEPSLDESLRQLLLKQLSKVDRGERSLCHGDFHPDNVILGETGPVVIDWLNATAGSSIADVARGKLVLEIARPVHRQNLLAQLVTTGGRRFVVQAYLKRYCQLAQLTVGELTVELAEWDPVLAALRLAEEIESELPILRQRIGGWADSES